VEQEDGATTAMPLHRRNPKGGRHFAGARENRLTE
jgi:hypothetical protein